MNPVTGNDKYPGLREDRPKKTICSAWDALPNLVKKNATIHLAPGVYREPSLTLTGRMVTGGSVIAIEGNTSAPATVRLSGTDEVATTTPVRFGLTILDQRNVEIRGVQFEYFVEDSIRLTKGASAVVRDCKFIGRQVYFIETREYSRLEAYNLDMDGIDKNKTNSGFVVCYMSYALLHGFNVRNCGVGVYVKYVSNAFVDVSVFASVRDCLTAYISCAVSDMTWMNGPANPLHVIENCDVGFNVFTNAVCLNSQGCTQYINVATHTKTATGGQISY